MFPSIGCLPDLTITYFNIIQTQLLTGMMVFSD